MTLSQFSHFLLIVGIFCEHALKFGIFTVLNVLFWKYTDEVAHTRISFTGYPDKETLIDEAVDFAGCLVDYFRRSEVIDFYVFHTVVFTQFNFETVPIFHPKLYLQRTFVTIQLHFIKHRWVSRLVHKCLWVSNWLFTGNPAGIYNSSELVLDLLDFSFRSFEHFGKTRKRLVHLSLARRRLA